MSKIIRKDTLVDLDGVNRVDKVFELFELYGESDYIGEPVTQKEHMVQAAMFAEERGYSDEMIVAALFHDIGHLIPNKEPMGDLGVKNHEKEGSEFLRRLGFNDTVCRLVESHVNAKRYLVSTNQNYKGNLSSASRQTLDYQGGFMSTEELDKFVNDPLFTSYLQLRQLDEMSKVQNAEIKELDYFTDRCLRCLNVNENN